MTKMFYLTKFRFMHKHDTLSLSHFSDFGNLKKKQTKKPLNQPTNQPSSLYRTVRTPRTRSLQLYCRIYIHTYVHMYIFLKGLSSVGHVNSQVTVRNMTSESLLHLSKVFNAVIIYLWPLFLNDIDDVICEVSLNDDLILPCY